MRLRNVPKLTHERAGFSHFIEDRYEKEPDWYDQKAVHNKRIHGLPQVVVIVSSAVTPALILMDESNLRMLAVFTSVIIAISTSAIKTSRFHENWLDYRTTAETMRREHSLYNTGAGDYPDADDRQRFFVERIESLISRENTKWLWFQKKKE